MHIPRVLAAALAALYEVIERLEVLAEDALRAARAAVAAIPAALAARGRTRAMRAYEAYLAGVRARLEVLAEDIEAGEAKMPSAQARVGEREEARPLWWWESRLASACILRAEELECRELQEDDDLVGAELLRRANALRAVVDLAAALDPHPPS